MSATGEIATIGRESWAVSLGSAITRWGRRRAVRAQLKADRRAAVGQERRAELEERMLLENEMRAFEHEHARAKNLTAVYRGL